MFARVRATAGRIATVAGSAVLTGGLVTDSVTGPGVIAAAATAGVGLATNAVIWRGPAAVRSTAMAVYAAPHAGCAVLLVAERLAPAGTVSVLMQASAVALWTGATWLLRPSRLARDLVAEAVVQEIAEANGEAAADADAQVAVPEPVYASPQARWWAEEIAGEDGIAPGTVLVEHQQVSEHCVAAVIGSAQRGTPVPVPEDFTARLSAYIDLPEDLIEIGPVPGRGAGVRLLVMGQRPQLTEPEAQAMTAGSDEEVWAEIAATAMPGVQLLEATTYETRKELT